MGMPEVMYTDFSKQLKTVLPNATDNKQYVQLMKLAQHFPKTQMANDIMKYFFNFVDRNLYQNGDLKVIDDLQTEYLEKISKFLPLLHLGNKADLK